MKLTVNYDQLRALVEAINTQEEKLRAEKQAGPMFYNKPRWQHFQQAKRIVFNRWELALKGKE